MHYWGDEDFDWNSLNQAIHEITDDLWKARICVHSKEKYGTARFEYLHFWDGTLHGFIKFKSLWIRWKWFYFNIDMPIIGKITRIIGLHRLFVNWQIKQYHKTFDKVIKKYPHVKDELLFDYCKRCGFR